MEFISATDVQGNYKKNYRKSTLTIYNKWIHTGHQIAVPVIKDVIRIQRNGETQREV